MTTPQLIDGGKSPPCPHHPAVRSETMTERRRCLAWTNELVASAQEIVELIRDDNSNPKLLGLFEVLVQDLESFRTRIESGEQA